MDLISQVTLLGGVCDRTTLVRLRSAAEVDRALRSGVLVRDARGRYALPSTRPAIRTANRVGGIVSHRSAAQYWGWAQKSPPPLPEVTPSGKDEPKIAVPVGDPPSKLVIRDLKRGNGPAAAAGKTLAVDYKGVRYDDGKAFDSSWSTGRPFQFILGARQVIKGWEQGLKGMRVGGRRELIIPPELAYGGHGQGSIRPNETIVFVVDLLDVR